MAYDGQCCIFAILNQ